MCIKTLFKNTLSNYTMSNKATHWLVLLLVVFDEKHLLFTKLLQMSNKVISGPYANNIFHSMDI